MKLAYKLCEALSSSLWHAQKDLESHTLCGLAITRLYEVGMTDKIPGACRICKDEMIFPMGTTITSDPVNSPKHYTSHPSGVECIEITEHMMFNLGNAIKYIWRHGLKSGDTVIEDLEKARYYIDREIQRVTPK